MTTAVGGGGSRKGRIPDRDITAIRDQARIEEVVGDYVQLRRAGADSLKGLCPFHDEKSPSFHVRPNHGHFHCFGCGEGGDVYAFIQKMEHVSFVEAVEMLADRIGYQVTYTGGGNTIQRTPPRRNSIPPHWNPKRQFPRATTSRRETSMRPRRPGSAAVSHRLVGTR